MCVEKYDTSAKGASKNCLGMLIDHRNLFSNINFPKFPWLFLNFPNFQQNSKFPWQILKFPDFSMTLTFPDFSLTSGNPVPIFSVEHHKNKAMLHAKFLALNF